MDVLTNTDAAFEIQRRLRPTSCICTPILRGHSDTDNAQQIPLLSSRRQLYLSLGVYRLFYFTFYLKKLAMHTDYRLVLHPDFKKELVKKALIFY